LRKRLGMVSAFVCIVLTGGFSPAETGEATVSSRYPMTVQDDLGYEIVLDHAPQRMISLAPSNTEILCALGLEERILAVSRFCNYPPSIRKKPTVGGIVDFNIEKIVSLEPDLIVAVRGNPRQRLNRLQQLGVPVYAVEAETLEGILRAIKRLGVLCAVDERARTLAVSMRARLAAVAAAVQGVTPAKRVYIGDVKTPYYAAGPGTFVDELIALAGAVNIARGARTRWPILSAEQILVENPEVVFLGLNYDESTESARNRLKIQFMKDPIWSGTTAGRKGELYILDPDVLHRPGPRVVDAAETIARLLYPDRVALTEGKN